MIDELGASNPETTRNLVLLTFDQWRGDWCDPDHPIVELPEIMGLARNGWSCRCYATSPQCVPARISWMTGLYPSQFGVTTHRNVDLPGTAPSIVRTLKERGWWTELVGKSHLTAHIRGRDLRDEEPRLQQLGFDRVLEIAGPRGLRHVSCALTDAWKKAGVLEEHRADLERRYASGNEADAWAVRPTVLPDELYPDIWLARQAEQRLRALPDDRPWLLWISFVGPHEPFDTPAPWSGHHRDADLPSPSTEPPWIHALPQGASARKARETWQRLDAASIDACRRDYADHLRLIDDQVGRLLATLSERPDAARTAVAVTADHGELLGDGGMLYKGTFLEGAVRVPWIYRPAPEESVEADIRTDHPLAITTLLRNCFENLTDGGGLDGLIRRSRSMRDVRCEFADELMVVSGHRKLVVDGRRRPLWAIDLEQDPHEQVNVITDDRRTWRRDPIWKSLRREATAHLRRRRRRGWRETTLKDVR